MFPALCMCFSPLRSFSLSLFAKAARGLLALSLVLTLANSTSAMAQGECPAAWVPGIGSPGTNDFVYPIAVLPGGDVIVGGAFTTVGGVPANYIARYNPLSGVWSALGSGTNSGINALAVLPCGDVIVGGAFTTAGGMPANRIARYNPITNVWSTLGTGTDAVVRALAVLPGGDVIVGGSFSVAGGVAASRIARVNPTTGTWTALGSGTSGVVSALAVLPDGDVIVGGAFFFAGGIPASTIARYHPLPAGGGDWSALGSGTNNVVYALAVLQGGDVIVGGAFTTAGGLAANRIARYNPVSGTWSTLRTGTNNSVYALAVLPNGDAIAGGTFTSAGGVPADRIARYSPVGGVWSAFGAGADDDVYGLGVLPNGHVILGGIFTTAGGVPSSNIARYFPGVPAPSILSQPLSLIVAPEESNAVFYCEATGGSPSSPPTYQWRFHGVPINTSTNPSAATPVLSIRNVKSGDLGSYDCLVRNSCGGSGTASEPARLSFVAPPTCPADFNDDGGIDGSDIEAFILRWENGC